MPYQSRRFPHRIVSYVPNITRPIVTQAAPSGNSKQRILLLRQAVKSVRRADELRQMHPGLVIGIITAVGTIGLVWLLGHLGFRLGFANALGVPELLGEPGGGLATGALVVIMLPLRVFEAGIEQPMWLMLAFLAIGIPGGALAAAKPVTPGGPRPKPAVQALLWMGSIFASLVALLIVAYVVSPLRQNWLSSLPTQLTGVDGWLNGLHIAAGLDGLVVVAAALWMVLAWRIAVPVWMRAIAISATTFAVAVVTVAMGMSNALVAHLHLERSVVSFGDLDEQGQPRDYVLVGYTREHAVILQLESGTAVLEMFDVPTSLRLIERQSIANALLEAMPEEEF